MQAQKIFTGEDFKRVEQAVVAAKREAAIEIVPAVHRASGHYEWVAYRVGLAGLLAASCAGAYLLWRLPFAFDWRALFLLQFAGFLIGWIFGHSQHLVRWIVGPKHLAEEAHHAARAAFALYGLHHAKNHSGILVFVSALERRVVILADHGAHAATGDHHWKQECDQIATGIRAGKPGAALAEALVRIGQKLAGAFPPGGGSEFSAEMRVR